MKRLLRFAFTGGVGFLADALMLLLLVRIFALDPLIARLISIGFALCVTWSLNRALTFGASTRPIMVEGARYGGVGLTTSLVNYLTYSALILLLPGIEPLIALAIASALAMALSYLGYSRLVFDR